MAKGGTHSGVDTRALLLAGAVALLLGSCSSSGPRDRSPAPTDRASPRIPPARPAEPTERAPDPPLLGPDVEASPGSFEDLVVEQALALLGSPYRYAGITPRGFDCSGFVYFVYSRLGIELPRATLEQATVGAWIPLDEVDLGDLLFFAEGEVPSHVGLVTSRPGQPLTMVHSSSSRGVIETVVDESDYWLDRLKFARRQR